MEQESSRPVLAVHLGARAAVIVAAICAVTVAGYLRLYQLGEGGLGNPMYAAGVRSMTKSVHNFFFVSLDPFGTYMIDKPPLALWLQSLSAMLLGYGGFALMLPQALAGVAGVTVIFVVVRRLSGDFTALVAATLLAVLPASVLVSRNNTMDTIVMALSLAAALLAARAAARGGILPLVLAGAVTGLAFNTKGFEAFVALPGIIAYFWLASGLTIRRRLAHLCLFGVVLVVVGLSWVTAVSLFPASERPLVLNSDGNSIWNLTLIYNGLDRVTGSQGNFNPANALTSASPGAIPIGVLYGGERGPLRVFGEYPGPLIAAAIPTAFAGALLLLLDLRSRAKRPAAALWLLWFAAGLVAFSASRLGSAHYLEMMSPGVAACSAAAASAAVTGGRIRRLIALAGAAGSALYCLARLTELGDLSGMIGVLAAVALGLVAFAVVLVFVRPSLLMPAVAFGPFACVVAVLFAMSVQAIHDAPVEGVQPGVVILSEDNGREVKFDPALPAYSWLTGRYAYLDRALNYLEQRTGPDQYIAAVRSFFLASDIIAERDVAALPILGEFRSRPEISAKTLEAEIDSGRLSYFLIQPAALRTAFPEAAALLQLRCRENLSAVAGLAPQTGYQLLKCS